MEFKLPKRKLPAHGVLERPARANSCFCHCMLVNRRRPILANQSIHHQLRLAWQQSTAWLVERYVSSCPINIHFFAGLNGNLCHWRIGLRYWNRSLQKEMLPRESFGRRVIGIEPLRSD